MQMISMSADTTKTVSMSLTWGIEAWISEQAQKRGVSKSLIVREILEKAMRESETKSGKAA